MAKTQMSDLEQEARAKLGMEDNESTAGVQKKFKEVQESIRNAGENESEGDDDLDNPAAEGDTSGAHVPEPKKIPDGALNNNPSDYTKR